MIALTLGEIARVVAGTVDGPDDILVTADPSHDSRAVVPGGLFVAVVGERVDGHDFAAAAVAAGAAGVLAQRRVSVPAVIVADPVEAMGVLAHHVVSRLTGLAVVGITGSQGKTSTKDVLAQLLETRGPTVAAVGSFNTEIGVPLTALRATEHTRFLVCEMGARGRGHIEYLATMVRPRIGVVLNVGVAHVGQFGTKADIAAAKGELVEALPPEGLAVLNADDPLVSAMADRTPARILTFGSSEHAELQIREPRLDAAGHLDVTLAFDGRSDRLTVPLVGVHQAWNVAAAAGVALACGIGWEQTLEALRHIVPRSRWRMELVTSAAGVTVLNDAYNANPDSMRAALAALVEIGRGHPGRTIAVLGEMRELGDTAVSEHDAIGRHAAQLGVDAVLAVGTGARQIGLGAAAEPGWNGQAWWDADSAAAIGRLGGVVAPGDVVLVKASRAAGLEQVALALAEGSRG